MRETAEALEVTGVADGPNQGSETIANTQTLTVQATNLQATSRALVRLSRALGRKS